MITTFSNHTVHPLAGKNYIDPDTGLPRTEHEQAGLTKREYFAAMAMQGLLAGKYCSSSLNAA